MNLEFLPALPKASAVAVFACLACLCVLPDAAAAARQNGARQELERYRRELERYRRAGNTESEAYALVQMAQLYESLNEPENAVEHYKQVLPLVETESGKKATVFYQLGKLHISLRRHEQGLDYFAWSLPLWQEVKDYRFEAQTHLLMGQAHHSLGDVRQAFAHFKQALPLFEKLPDPEAVAGAYLLLGATAPTHREVLRYYNEALTRWQKLGSKADEASTLDAIASFYSGLNDRVALRYYRQALTAWEQVGDQARQAQVHQDMGLLYVWLDESQHANDSYRNALALWRRSGRRADEAEASVRAGWASYWAGEQGESLRYFSKAAEVWRSQNEETKEALALTYASFIQARLGLRTEALETLSRVTSLDRSLDARAPGKSLLTYFGGLAYFLLNDRARALQSWNRELELHNARGDRTGQAQALYTLGWAHDTYGERQKALDFYLRSLAAREAVRAAAVLEEFKTDLAGQTADAYQRAVLLSAELGNQTQAFELTERARARTLLDQLSNIRIDPRRGADSQTVQQEQALRLEIGELRRRLGTGRALPSGALSHAETETLSGLLAAREQEYGDVLVRLKASNAEYASLRSVESPTLKQLQALLNEETTLLSYFVTHEKTLAFVVTRDSLRVVELCEAGRCVGERELRDAITKFRGFADLSAPRPRNLEHLYGWLIRPLRKYLRTPALCIVPHGVLHYLPFGALSDGGRFLDEDYTINYTPSAGFMSYVRQKHKAGGEGFLAVAQSRVEGLPILRYGDGVARQIAGSYNTQPLVGPTATETAFRARAAGRAHIFLAAHGKLNSVSPLFSSIFLAPDKEHDGLLEVHEIYGLDLTGADLVVLSACQTQLGELSRGDDVVGLNRAFVYAGTPTVVASLWSVREQQTGDLMKEFYNNLKAGMGKADALRKAQALVRASHPHPYYWAAFVLTGEP